ncbi:hypothetical protein YC2023_007022 [Brassica napus]|uniref:Uncharacterized protein n=2 Tax=Brassica TaxID=3705 RepID=A0A3P6FLC9_BRAOL|nr:unnamed protein product [Brassica napus]VDD47811.1 unnamed protein product [Brassica oleracea]
MSSDKKDHNSDSDSDGPPEEFTQEQAKVEDAALRRIQRENKARVAREKKESRRHLLEKITPKKSRKIETFEEEEAEEEEDHEALANKGFLSKNIIDFLAQRNKQKNGSDSEQEEANKQHPRKKKQKSSGIETVLYKEIPPPECLKIGLAFLKKRKAQVPRSSSILNNSSQALRLITGAASANKHRQKK